MDVGSRIEADGREREEDIGGRNENAGRGTNMKIIIRRSHKMKSSEVQENEVEPEP